MRQLKFSKKYLQCKMTIVNATAIAKSSPLDGAFLRSKDEPKTRPNIAKKKRKNSTKHYKNR